MKNGKITKQFPEKIRCFALTLFFYSPKAYNYVRQTFKNTLPAVSTIRAWYAGIDGEPGFSSDALAAIKNEVQRAKSKGEETVLCLMQDEMAIRQQLVWDNAKKKIVGYINFGTSITHENEDALPVAKDALVYLVRSVSGKIGEKFSMPVAYFLINGLKYDERAVLTREIILTLSKTGAKIAAMTFDGLPANIAMCERLGANFDNDITFIVNPHTNDNIYIFLDNCHMLKLARNRIGALSYLFDYENKKIEWQFFIELEKMQRENGIQFGNKLNKSHILWKRREMCVRLAVQTLSNSVADSMELMRTNGIEQFEGSEATEKYCKYLNKLFDIFNSFEPDAFGFKKTLDRDNSGEFFAFFDQAIKYFEGLKLEENDKSILKTKSKTSFLGYIVNMKSLKGMYTDYIESGILNVIRTRDLCQDHLEMLFGRIRKMGGCNDNPNSQQLSGAMRRLYVHNEVRASDFANCVDTGSRILTVSSCRSNQKPPTNIDINFNRIEDVSDEETTEEDLDPVVDVPNVCVINDTLRNHIVAYTSSQLEKNILESTSNQSIKCSECSKVFSENEKLIDAFVDRKADNSDLQRPCLSTFEICKLSEETFLTFQHKEYQKILDYVLEKLNLNDLYTSSNFDHFGGNHKNVFVKLIVEKHLKLKFSHITKCKTRDLHDDFYRNDLNRFVHLHGQ